MSSTMENKILFFKEAFTRSVLYDPYYFAVGHFLWGMVSWPCQIHFACCSAGRTKEGFHLEIGIGILAFLVYIIFVMAWYLLLKRSIAEAMLLGLIIVCAFNGVGTLPQTFAASLTKALKQDVMAAIILFTVMASIMTQTGIITRLVNILNSILGRFAAARPMYPPVPALCSEWYPEPAAPTPPQWAQSPSPG